MPKLTREFRGMPDYQEAFQNADKEFVFIGHPDDLEEPYQGDLKRNQERSQYFGCVLLPEWRREDWDYEKNKAFFAGVIDAHRSVLLISDITHFMIRGTTIDELFWLQDNGYEFIPFPKDPLQTLAIPSRVPDGPQMRDYNRGRGTEKMASWQARGERFEKNIKNPVLLMRPQPSEYHAPRP